MKTKKESNDSPVISLESWRKLNRGERAPSRALLSDEFLFKIAGYVRLSPSGDDREEGSLVSHPQRIKRFVEDKNLGGKSWGEIVEWYTDKDLSGKDMNRFEKRIQTFTDVFIRLSC